jgi:hypothetical protein
MNLVKTPFRGRLRCQNGYPLLKEKRTMKNPIAVILSLLYMFALALFLSFAAMFVCDGYDPVGWGWKGLSLHCAIWTMPLSLLAGSVLASLAIRPRLATALLVIGTGPLVGFVLWMELQRAFSNLPGWRSPWPSLWLLAVVLTAFADLILIRRACERDVGLSVIPSS